MDGAAYSRSVFVRGQEVTSVSTETRVGPVGELPAGKVTGAGHWAVGNVDGERFAVSRRCRHLRADLAGGSIDADGCLECPWHHAKYDVHTGRMVSGPQGVFAKIPGFDALEKAFTAVLPLRRGRVTERDATLFVE
jgi:nitrite reductase/ring-hydroxylating ferredoxin subunit